MQVSAWRLGGDSVEIAGRSRYLTEMPGSRSHITVRKAAAVIEQMVVESR
jgi:hypothetical protein